MTEHDRSLPPLESLLQHRSWVQAVARRLLRDEAAAEDLAQEAWVRALRSPPDPARDPKPWLRRVLKNLASNARRGAGRRARHEHDGGELQARVRRPARSPAALVAEAEQHRRLVGHVLDLEEPFKTVLVLRFYEGLTPTEIAQRTDTAVGTVHSRLSRAVARLKTRLDAEEGGDRKAWIAGLLPLADVRDLAPVGAGAGTAAATAGVLMTLTKSKLAWLTLLLAGCLVGGALLATSLTSGEDDPATDLALRGADAPERGPELETRGRVRAAAAPEREDLAAGRDAPDAAPPAAAGVRWRGVVRDSEGRPVRGVEVFVLPREASGVNGPAHRAPRLGGTSTDAEGRFAVSPGKVRHPRLVAWSDWHLAASLDLAGRDPARPIELVLQPPRVVRVRVTREGHEGDLPLAVTLQTVGDLNDRTHDPAQQATWRQSAEATEAADVTLPMRLNTTAPLEVTFEAPRGFTTIPLHHRLPAATGGPEDDATQRCAFRVVPSATLRYDLVDAATGEPVPGDRRATLFLYEQATRAVVASYSAQNGYFAVETGLPPGRFAYEFQLQGYEPREGELIVRRVGEAITGTLRMTPQPSDARGRLLLRPRPVGPVPPHLADLARRTGVVGAGWVVFLRSHDGGAWVDTDAGIQPDGQVLVRPSVLGTRSRLFPEGTYDIVVAESGTGRAALLRGVRLFADQENRIDLPLVAGTFVKLHDLADADTPLRSLEVLAPDAREIGPLPIVHFWPRGAAVGYGTFVTAAERADLVRVPRAPRVLGPFPGSEVHVRLVPPKGAAQTIVVR